MHRVEDIPKVVPKKKKSLWVCTTIRLANRVLYFRYPILPFSHTPLYQALSFLCLHPSYHKRSPSLPPWPIGIGTSRNTRLTQPAFRIKSSISCGMSGFNPFSRAYFATGYKQRSYQMMTTSIYVYIQHTGMHKQSTFGTSIHELWEGYLKDDRSC